MSALKYNSRIRIERLAPPAGDPTDPEYGAAAPEWTLLAEVWAEVQDVMPSRSEQVANGVALAADSARVRIRYRADVTPDMRIVEKNNRRRTLLISAGPAAIGGMRELEFMVERFSS